MNTEQTNNTLINSLRNLFFRVSELELNMRTNVLRNRAGAEMVEDISSPLLRYIDRLAAESKKTKGIVAGVLKKRYPSGNRSQQFKQHKLQQGEVKAELDGLASYYKESAVKNASTTYLGEKLQSSTWSHLHAALMHARLGDIAKAKLHADIANQSLKEAAHYMEKKDYKVFSDEVKITLNTLSLK